MDQREPAAGWGQKTEAKEQVIDALWKRCCMLIRPPIAPTKSTTVSVVACIGICRPNSVSIGISSKMDWERVIVKTKSSADRIGWQVSALRRAVGRLGAAHPGPG